MTKNDYPALELESEFPADFLRQLPFTILMLPELLRRPFTKASIFLVQNGRGEPYHRLDISAPLPSGRHTTIREFSLGPLDDAQLSLVNRLITAHQNRKSANPQRLLKKALHIIRQYETVHRQAYLLAQAFASRAGFRLHGGSLYKCRKQNPQDIPTIKEFPAHLTDEEFGSARAITKHLQEYACDTATQPVDLLHSCLCIVQIIAETTVRQLEDILHDVALERMQMISICGCCPPLSKREARAVIKLEKKRRYLEKLVPGIDRVIPYLEGVEAA